MNISRPIFSDFKLKFHFDVARETSRTLLCVFLCINLFVSSVSFHIECFFPFIHMFHPRFLSFRANYAIVLMSHRLRRLLQMLV